MTTEDHQHPSELGGVKSDSGVIEWQLIALTYWGGWYRLALPNKYKDKKREDGGGGGNTSGSTSGSSRESVGGVAGGIGRRGYGIGPSPLGLGGLGSVVSGSPPKAMSRRGSAASTLRGPEKGKEKERDREKESRSCVLQEYRRFGRWDGWG